MELLAAARAIHFASLMAIFGGSTYAVLLRRAGFWKSPPKGVRALFAIAATLAIVSGIIWFCLIAGQMSGSWQGSVDPSVLQLAASGTRFGHIFLTRFIGLIGLWLVCVIKPRRNTLALPILAGLLLVSLAPISHAAASGGDIATTGAVSDAIHLATAGFWLGGLMVLSLLIASHRGDGAALAGSLRIFSFWGSAVVALLAITGVMNALSILPVPMMSLSNPYFDLLLVKVGLTAVMVVLAALNRWRFAPALPGGGERSMRQLASSVGLEIALGLLVVAIVGILGTMAPH
jgi:putative copper resistance protein D